MFDSRDELLGRIRLGEDSFLEFKDVRFAGAKVRGPGRDRLADSLAAFANSRGGVFVLGVDDATHAVVGIPGDRVDAVVDDDVAVVRVTVPSAASPAAVPPRSLFIGD